MDEALDLADYLPVYFKTAIEEEYISFLWSALESNYDDKKYQFAFSGTGLLLANHYPRFRGAPFGYFRTLTRRPPSVDSG